MRLLPVFLLAFLPFVNAQIESLPLLKGQVTDKAGEPLIGATIKVFQGDKLIRGAITDFDGRFNIKLAPGIYDLECVYTGYMTKKSTNISIKDVKIRQVDLVMDEPPMVYPVFHEFCPPLIDMMPGNTGNIFSAYQIGHLY